MRLNGSRSLDEQPHRAILLEVLVASIFRRHGERKHRIDPFSLGAERLTAGGDEVRRWPRPQHFLRHGRHGADHVLAGVEHQQQPSDGKQTRHVLPRGGSARI